MGTPALFVDEDGFRDSIEDGVNGRLLPRDDPVAWQEALNGALDSDVRKRWASSGRDRITELDLSPDAHARRIARVIEEITEGELSG